MYSSGIFISNLVNNINEFRLSLPALLHPTLIKDSLIAFAYFVWQSIYNTGAAALVNRVKRAE